MNFISNFKIWAVTLTDITITISDISCSINLFEYDDVSLIIEDMVHDDDHKNSTKY